MAHRSLLRLVGGVVAALLVSVTPISAQSIVEQRVDRFKLWNACEPIYLGVEYLGDEAIKMGLTREAITTTVRSRLRAARLRIYRGRDPYLLYVNVTTLSRGTAFSVRLEFKKRLPDPELNGKKGFATTWNTMTVGQGDAAYILSVVSRLTDQFIDEYLRVNEPSCPRSPIDP